MKSSTALQEHIPLKQGLRQNVISHASRCIEHSRAYSTKTRIKTQLVRCKQTLPLIQEHIPLKQGLRRRVGFCANYLFDEIQEHIPLKQGLRLL